MPEFHRRDFLKIVGASAGAAAAAGCSDPVQKLIPYVVQPEEITPGIPVYYASTCQECPTACGLHVRTREGRPIKLEGNPDHPLIIGRVYNNDNMPPYKLPDEKTKSTIKSRSSKDGGGFNEFRFEDKKGEEQIFMHGEKDRVASRQDMRCHVLALPLVTIRKRERGWFAGV